MRLKLAAHSLTVAILTAATVVIGAGPASAEPYHAYCHVDEPNYDNCVSTNFDNVSAIASYDDATNDVCAEDSNRDGHSAVVAYWKKGQPNNWSRVWAHGGFNTTTCRDLSGLTENAEYVIQACIGEWDKTPANRNVLDCGPPKDIYL